MNNFNMVLSSKRKILLVFGTRPEAIKMAPLVKEFQKYPELFEVLVCVTAQHREMLDQVLKLFEIIPDYDLNIMKVGQDLYDVTSRVLLGMRDVLKESKPDVVLVHGDTTTSTVAALAAFYQKIPVGHIEAGLRTHNIYSPWPEEMNRQITSRIAKYNFAPTPLSKQNLLLENIPEERIEVTGNTVIDALYLVIEKLANDLNLKESIEKQLINFGLPAEKLIAWHFCNSKPWGIESKLVESRKLVLITGHRRENFGHGFLNICEAIKELAEAFPRVDFVYPMHLNPNVRKPISEVFGNGFRNFNDTTEKKHFKAFPLGSGLEGASNIYLIEPLDYLPFVYLMNISYLILTDSGGIQEEAPSLGKPVLVMRDTTERPEALEAGTVKLVGTDKQRITDEVSLLIKSSEHYAEMSKACNPYGVGKACKKIIESFNRH
jgi:UDP-N-acetylglucosamine 2-epimerase (non-hydrolysing)